MEQIPRFRKFDMYSNILNLIVLFDYVSSLSYLGIVIFLKLLQETNKNSNLEDFWQNNLYLYIKQT